MRYQIYSGSEEADDFMKSTGLLLRRNGSPLSKKPERAERRSGLRREPSKHLPQKQGSHATVSAITDQDGITSLG